MSSLETARVELSEACRQIADSGLVSSSSGNVSVRVGDEILITPRRGRLDTIDPATCVRVRISDGTEVEERVDDFQPSSETPLHLAVYRNSDAGAVVHTHSTQATAFGLVRDELPPIHYLLAFFGGPVRVAPYATFGSDELAGLVADAIEGGRKAALLRNHGAVTYASTLDRAVDLAHQLEWLCEIYLTASAHGEPTLLDQDELDRVVHRGATLNYGQDG